jgi:hypothetical protein
MKSLLDFEQEEPAASVGRASALGFSGERNVNLELRFRTAD